MGVGMAILIYVGAALGEIAGCFAFWAWMRRGQSAFWIGPGLLSLAIFAWLLTRTDAEFAGRAYAAYGGIDIAVSLFWLWRAEGVRPDGADILGAAFCIAGAGVILFGRKAGLS